jgi:RNA 2',3'-cyclic 3'-phosphodiesterase
MARATQPAVSVRHTCTLSSPGVRLNYIVLDLFYQAPKMRLEHEKDARLHNIFFALYPPPEQARVIWRLADRMSEEQGWRGPRVPRERLHITLNHLGGFPSLPRRLISAAGDAVSQLVMRSFVLAMNRVVSFESRARRSPRVLTGDDGLIGVRLLHGAIQAALAHGGFKHVGPRAITPHLTLARTDGMAPEHFIDPVAWRVREVLLIHSPYGEGRHDVVGRWALAG